MKRKQGIQNWKDNNDAAESHIFNPAQMFARSLLCGRLSEKSEDHEMQRDLQTLRAKGRRGLQTEAPGPNWASLTFLYDCEVRMVFTFLNVEKQKEPRVLHGAGKINFKLKIQILVFI